MNGRPVAKDYDLTDNKTSVDEIYDSRVAEVLQAIKSTKSQQSLQHLHYFDESSLLALSLLPANAQAIENFTKRTLENEYLQSKMPLNPNSMKHLSSFDHQLPKEIAHQMDNVLADQCHQIVEGILARCLIDTILSVK